MVLDAVFRQIVRKRCSVVASLRLTADGVKVSVDVPELEIVHEERANVFARRMENASAVLLGMQSKVLELDVQGLAKACVQLGVAGVQLKQVDVNSVAGLRDLLEKYVEEVK